ncbi:hypothetical protein F503_04072 [Ophiostoma piceae UAMH 11346]|uniref:Uncharacterized protein n=1 Tax=Ophiostoma piceae (strain UAMH 11346) TaxID=1262450 RepID=S3C960_OPHP1|nr:hypothetical protein F503_04072 [Ophiostoma piceae UAMH 11346]
MSSLDSSSPCSVLGTPSSGCTSNISGTSYDGAARDLAPATRKRKASVTLSQPPPVKPSRSVRSSRTSRSDREDLSSLFKKTSNKLNALRNGVTQAQPSPSQGRVSPASIDS